ncbi:hypothetical protein [Snodgrassella alvi]|uniref:hypothetical protein n=2 Tax=Snodgrassella alvi TaxID=1196083 RepID=UPI0012FE05EA|nr:hypothetical protein [Snodgrassella alvi]
MILINLIFPNQNGISSSILSIGAVVVIHVEVIAVVMLPVVRSMWVVSAPTIVRMKSSEIPNQMKTATSVSAKGNMNYAQQIYVSLREHGLSAQQAKIMSAEIGRENLLNLDFLFGSHADPKIGATNVGLISWQGIRAKKLV